MLTDHEQERSGPDSSAPIAPFSIPDRVPVFPLPNVVFFPKTYLPLHIFEPRYRRMVADAAASGQCIAMALLKEGWEPDYYSNPPIYPLICVGRLVSVQSLPDGRSNILLQGLRRADIHQEHFEKPYREATIAVKADFSDAQLQPGIRDALMKTLEQYLRAGEESSIWKGIFREEMNDEVLVNTLATYLDCTPVEKQFLLEAEDLRQRARRLGDLIQFLLHNHHGAKGWE